MLNWKDNKVVRKINQNLGTIIFAILVLVFVFIIAKAFNLIENATLRNNNNKVNSQQEQVSYLTDAVIDNKTAASNKNILNEFIEACNNKDVNTAYNLLSDDCKQEFYKTEDIFSKYYIEKNFSIPRTYQIQAVATEDKTATYLLSLEEDIMVSGSVNDNNTVKDYITLTSDNKINLNGFMVKKSMNKSSNKDNITITVKEKRVYMDYEEYTFTVKNETSNTIKMDSKESLISTYLLNSQDVKYSAYIDEMFDQDLIVNPNSTKEITIKFNKMYNTDYAIKKIVYSDIVQDYEGYEKRVNFNKVKVEIEL